MKKSTGSIGILYSKGAVLCFRELDRDLLPRGGYRLFSTRGTLFASLAKDIKKVFKAEVSCLHDEGMFPLNEEETSRVYLIEAKTPFRFGKNMEARFVKESDLNDVHLSPSSRKVLTRFFALLHHSLGLVGEKRNEAEDRAALLLCRSLHFFEKKGTFPKEERKIFEDMYLHDAPLVSLRSAHRYFLEAYHLDINEYLDRVRIKRKSRELS